MKDSRVLIKHKRELRLIEPANILFFRSLGSYSIIRFVNGEEYKFSYNLKTLLEDFKQVDYFFRVHRSYVINLKHIQAVVKVNSANEALRKPFVSLSDEVKIPLSDSFKESFINKINKIYKTHSKSIR